MTRLLTRILIAAAGRRVGCHSVSRLRHRHHRWAGGHCRAFSTSLMLLRAGNILELLERVAPAELPSGCWPGL